MIRTVLLDDDVLSRKAAAAALSAFQDIELSGSFTNSIDFYRFLGENQIDLLFLDIELENESGFEIAKRLRTEYPEILFVFLTGHSSYAIDGYDFQPVNFLTKPINNLKLAQTISEIRNRLEKNRKQQISARIMLKMKRGYKIVDVQNLLYFERRSRKIYMFSPDGEEMIGSYTMAELEEMLEPYGFFSCHQSFLISLYKVQEIRDIRRQLYEVELNGCKNSIPVSRHKYHILLEKLKEIGI